jgi:hypothetical protein
MRLGLPSLQPLWNNPEDDERTFTGEAFLVSRRPTSSQKGFQMRDIHHAAETDRVRANTENSVNSRIDNETEYRLGRYASEPDASVVHHLRELDREWDLERVLEVESASMALIGLSLSALVDKRLLVLPGIVSAMVFLHATQGWYPLLPIFRRLGLRSRSEIDRERYAIKAMRGDFAEVVSAENSAKAKAAWRAVLA